MTKTKKVLLKDISFEEWSRVINPWGEYKNPDSLIRKIVQSSILIKKEKGKSGLYFTQSGWNEFKNFIYPENLNEWGKIKTEAPSNFTDYNVYVDKYRLENEDNWNWEKNANHVSKMIEEFAKEEKETDDTIDKKIYDFMVKIIGDQEVEYEIKEEEAVQEGRIKNILLIGRAGSGKSTSGNVLVNKDNKFKEVFKESSGSVSETKGYQVETFKAGEDIYRIIDTVGIGDTGLSEEDTLFKLGEVAQELELGINQIFFVGKERFTKKEVEAFGMLGLVFFDKEVENYSSIVRTAFPEFKKKDACKEDIKNLKKANPETKKIIESVGERIIHIDAPFRRYLGNPDSRFNYVREDWKESNEKLWEFLQTQKHLNYLPQNLKNLNERIRKHFEDEKEKENRLINRIKDLEAQINSFRDKSDEIKKQIEREKQSYQAKTDEYRKELERLTAQREGDIKINEEKLREIQKDLEDIRKKAIVDGVREHENSIYENIEQSAEVFVPFGGKIVDSATGGTAGSRLAYLISRK